MPDDKPTSPGEVTRLLMQYAGGDEQSLNEVIPIVYQELKALAQAQLNRSSVRRQLQTTALVHEAFEKLAVGQSQNFNGRRHFFAVASRAMRQIVVDSYRSEQAAKRGGGAIQVEIGTRDLVELHDPERVLLLDRAIESLAAQSDELAEIVDLSCFGGLSNQEIAELTATTVRTVQRQLLRAKAWIAHFLDVPDG